MNPPHLPKIKKGMLLAVFVDDISASKSHFSNMILAMRAYLIDLIRRVSLLDKLLDVLHLPTIGATKRDLFQRCIPMKHFSQPLGFCLNQTSCIPLPHPFLEMFDHALRCSSLIAVLRIVAACCPKQTSSSVKGQGR